MAVSATINTAPTISSGTATVYPQSNWPYGTPISGAPVGSSTTTGAVGTDGSVTFSGLNASTLYVAYQASPDRYVRFRTAAASAAPAGGGSLTPTAVKTGAYTAVSGDLVLVDTTSGGVTVTLPAAAAGASVGVKMVTQGATNAVTIAAAGSDVFNKAGGATTATLSLLNQGVVLTGSSGVWVVQADDLPLSGLDARYPSAAMRAGWAPGGISETFPRELGSGNLGITSGAMWLSGGLVLPANKTITSITVVASNAAGAGTPTHQWFALYDKTRALLGVTNDDTTTAWAAGAAKTLTLATSYTPTVDTPAYAGVLVTATTMPQLIRPGAQGDLWQIAPIQGGTSTTGLTTPATAPATAAALSGNAYKFYAYVS